MEQDMKDMMSSIHNIEKTVLLNTSQLNNLEVKVTPLYENYVFHKQAKKKAKSLTIYLGVFSTAIGIVYSIVKFWT